MDQVIVLSALALLTRVGLALYSAGACRAKNAAGVVLRAACDVCFSVLGFWCVGAAILGQSHNPVFAVDPRLLMGWAVEPGTVFTHAVLFVVATGLVGGAMAERSTFLPVCAASALLAGVIMPVASRWAWEGGWLGRLGFVDVGGAAALHVSAGACAAVAAAFVGARTGKYNRDGSATMIPGHNIPLAAIGVLLALAGWVGYIGAATMLHRVPGVAPLGSLASAADNALLAAAAAGAAALGLGEVRHRKPDVGLTLVGVLGGLVAISAAGGRLSTAPAVLIGAVAGVIVPMTSVWIDLRWRIDDPVAAAAIQLVGGAWGTLAAGLLLPGSIAGRLQHLGIQLLGLVVITVLSVVLSGLLFAFLKRAGRLRVGEADEYDGLDLAEHDVAAYPDFQQNMIKSYHMREA